MSQSDLPVPVHMLMATLGLSSKEIHQVQATSTYTCAAAAAAPCPSPLSFPLHPTVAAWTYFLLVWSCAEAVWLPASRTSVEK